MRITMLLCINRMKVIFKKYLEDQARNLTVDKEYEVIGIEGDSYRIVCDENEPYLYEPEQFEVLDLSQPDFWVRETSDDGELYAYPMVWFHGYFFEDYFENKPGFKEKFWSNYKRLYGNAKNT